MEACNLESVTNMNPSAPQLLKITPRPKAHKRRVETHMPRPDGRQGALKGDSLNICIWSVGCLMHFQANMLGSAHKGNLRGTEYLSVN
jgi:hypothetical protein